MESKLITTIFNALSNGFSKFVGVFKKNGLIYTMIVLIAFVLTYSLIINPIRIDKMLEERLEHQYLKEQKQTADDKQNEEKRRITTDNIISPMMEDIVDQFKVDRIMLFELHNGTKNISGTGFIYFSCVYEVINYDNTKIEMIGDNFQRQYTNQMLNRQIFNTLHHKDYMQFEKLSEYQNIRCTLFRKLYKFGESNLMIIPIKDKENKIVMMICVVNNENIDYDKIFEFSKPFIKQIQTNCL